MARQIAELMVTDKIDWNNVINELPEIAYILPQDLENLGRELKEKHALTLLMDSGRPKEVGKSI
jgi:hypothetical protein